MSHSRIALLSVVSVVAALGCASAPASAAQHAAPKPMQVTVTMTEFKFKLSVKQLPRVGTVIFKVVNKGKIEHDFKINGKKTPNIKPGKSATLKVVFKKKGRYAYLCTIPGHAAAGMKGTLAVVVEADDPSADDHNRGRRWHQDDLRLSAAVDGDRERVRVRV